MKNLKNLFHFRLNIKSRHLLIIMTLFLVSCIIGTFATGIGPGPLREAAGLIVVPFQNSIGAVSEYFSGVKDEMRTREDLAEENAELKAQIETLSTEVNTLVQDQEELRRLQELYDLDQEYDDYPKIAARIISKDPGNWYDTFMINRGSRDGVRVDNNVIGGKGLVGIVTEVGTTWATVRSIIDDSSSVSAMTVSTSDNFIVQGDLELIDEGKLRFVELYDQEEKVTTGEQIVTSNISEKYLEGLFIGYVSEIEQDTNNLTKTGTIVTPVDFRHLKNVFVITRNKQDVFEDRSTVNKQEVSEKEDAGNDPVISEEDTGNDTDISEEDTGNDPDVSEEDTGNDPDVSEEDTGIDRNVFEEGDDV